MSDTESAKNHLREHLASLIVHPVSEGFWSIYDTSKDLCKRNEQLDQVLRTFQNMLTKIPDWHEETLSKEVERIEKTSKCTYLDDLVMGVFLAYMKSFASLHYRGSSSHIDVEFERPSMEKFVHQIYIQSARKLWQVAYLFKTLGVSNEQQARNRQEIEKIINECLEQVIRSFLPWQTIAKQFSSASAPEPTKSEEARRVMFSEDSDSEDEEDEEGEEEKAPLQLSDEIAEIQFDDLDKKETPEEETDPLKEIESKIGDQLVLNL